MYWKMMVAVCLPESGSLQSHIARSLAPAKFTKKLAVQCVGVPFCEDCQRYILKLLTVTGSVCPTK